MGAEDSNGEGRLCQGNRKVLEVREVKLFALSRRWQKQVRRPRVQVAFLGRKFKSVEFVCGSCCFACVGGRDRTRVSCWVGDGMKMDLPSVPKVCGCNNYQS